MDFTDDQECERSAAETEVGKQFLGSEYQFVMNQRSRSRIGGEAEKGVGEKRVGGGDGSTDLLSRCLDRSPFGT